MHVIVTVIWRLQYSLLTTEVEDVLPNSSVPIMHEQRASMVNGRKLFQLGYRCRNITTVDLTARREVRERLEHMAFLALVKPIFSTDYNMTKFNVFRENKKFDRNGPLHL